MRGRFFGPEIGAGGSCLHCLMVNPPLVPIEARKVPGNVRGNPQQSDALYVVIHDRLLTETVSKQTETTVIKIYCYVTYNSVLNS